MINKSYEMSISNCEKKVWTRIRTIDLLDWSRQCSTNTFQYIYGLTCKCKHINWQSWLLDGFEIERYLSFFDKEITECVKNGFVSREDRKLHWKFGNSIHNVN